MIFPVLQDFAVLLVRSLVSLNFTQGRMIFESSQKEIFVRRQRGIVLYYKR